MKTCPKCDRINDVNAKKCKCQHTFKLEGSSSRMCAYSYNNQDCPRSGTHTETTQAGPNTKWYCIHHYNHWENPKAAQQALLGLLNGDLEIYPPNWKDVLLKQWVGRESE